MKMEKSEGLRLFSASLMKQPVKGRITMNEHVGKTVPITLEQVESAY
jgi:hypothetical protein